MLTLRVIIDDMLHGSPAAARYAEELTRELIVTAPPGCIVEGFVSASTEPDYERVADRLPGLARLHKSALARRELVAAWSHGFTRLPGAGMVHAPSLLAPLRRHDRLNNGDQLVVTIHDTLAWRHPEALSSRAVSATKALGKRAERYADAVVVPTHAVAAELSELLTLGTRIRVISGAPATAIRLPMDADDRAEALRLPVSYVVARTVSPAAIRTLVGAMADVDSTAHLLIVGPAEDDAELTAAATDAGLAARVRGLGQLADADLAVVLARASVFSAVEPTEGYGGPILDALALGTPVVHSDDASAVELTADAGITVALEGAPEAEHPALLAAALSQVLDDAQTAERLKYLGLDRSRAYNWRTSAERVWQLHADL